MSVATLGGVREQPRVADGASELLQDVFGKRRNPSRLVYSVASLPLGAPVALEIIFEVAALIEEASNAVGSRAVGSASTGELRS